MRSGFHAYVWTRMLACGPHAGGGIHACVARMRMCHPRLHGARTLEQKGIERLLSLVPYLDTMFE